MAQRYSAADIEVLEGLEPVRKRPAMYIGGTDLRGYHHLLWEIVDNAIDEVINGHATHIQVRLDEDYRGARVEDNGRGIPTDIHPQHQRPALELILTTLHAGGKFSGKNYQVAGGLHGVGSSVVNALSSHLEAEVRRDSHLSRQRFARGKAISELQRIKATKGSGTAIYFQPDSEIFGTKAKFDPTRIREYLQAKSYLHKGLRISFDDPACEDKESFLYPGGIADYLQHLGQALNASMVHAQAFALERADDPRMELVMQWSESPQEHIRSYANGIPTPSGGTHENGLKQGLIKAFRSYTTAQKLLPKGLQVSAEDVREGLFAILSVYVEEPQFQGQTKERLNNPEVTAKVESAVRVALEQWWYDNPKSAEAVVQRVILAARARLASRAAAAQVGRKTALGHRLNLPGKLADCSSTDATMSELFLVEGDSAGGNAKQGRDRRFQAILPLRGKVLNIERATTSTIGQNKELQDIISALGCGIGDNFDPARLRYHKIILLMDADSDGHHIATLLLTFFYRLLPQLIHQGYVYLAQPPLYRIDTAKQSFWASDDDERTRVLDGLPGNAKAEISRFKGLGEMTAAELRETTLDPTKRRILRITIDADTEVDRLVQDLMGKDPAPRFNFIMHHAIGADAEALDV